MNGFVRIFGSFLIVGACYTAYAAMIVPWIEPNEPLSTSQTPTVSKTQPIEEARKLLSNWFAPGDWELENPKVFETGQGMLLFDDYQPREAGYVEITPCTIVFLSSDEGLDEDERNRRAIVMQAPQGALLRFDPPMDFKQSKIGRLVGGELLDEVRIHSGQKLPGPEDDLHITTRDVVMTETDVTTPHRLDFRLGPHHGYGVGLHLRLDSAAGDGEVPVIRGVKALTLEQQIYFYLQPQSGGDVIPGGTASANAPRKPRSPPGPQQAAAAPPVEIRCVGPFTFDGVEDSALFRREVDVRRSYPDGTHDSMNGDQLKVFFTKGGAADAVPPTAGETRPAASDEQLQPTRVEFIGEPVVIRAPGNQLQARAQFVEHDVTTREVHLRDAAEVIVRQADRELRAPEMFLQPEESGELGSFRAVGRGRFDGRSPDDPARSLHAEWTSQVHFRPYEDRRVLSVYGAARVESIGTGAMTGDEIHLWLKEVPRSPAAPVEPGGKSPTELAPDRLLALGNVQIDSPQLVGVVQRFEAWFEQETPFGARPPAARRNEPRGAANVAPVAAVVYGSGPPAPADAAPPVASTPAVAPTPQIAPTPPVGSPSPVVPADVAPSPPQRQFRIDGDVLRLQVAVVDKEMQVREAVVEKNVRLVETKPARPDERPLSIQGDLLHVIQPTPEQSYVEVTGAPAFVEAQQMTVSGGKLTLRRPTPEENHMAIEGQGVLTMPVDRDLEGKPTAGRETLHLSWQGGMTFDGQVAQFDRGVEGRLTSQFLRTDRMKVAFDRPVGAAKSSPEQQTQIRQVDCFDGVFIESRTLAPDGNLTAVDRLSARNLSLDQQTGDFAADGPGEVTSVRRGSAGKPVLPGQPEPQPPPNVAPGAAAPPTAINYLNVTFHRNLAGNNTRREMTFHNQVRTLYGPVPDWTTAIDRDRPERWLPQTVLIDCDQLQVFARSDVQTGLDSYDLVAEGNTLVEGTSFTARAPRLTYAQAKDLLVIEGDARSDARLYHQKGPGLPRSDTSARRFMVWPSTNRVQVDGAAFLELTPN